MFRVIASRTNHLDIVMSGKMNADEMRTALNELDEKSKTIEAGTLLFTIKEFDFPSLGAMAVEFSRMPLLFRMMRRFKRMGVVCDKAWVRKVSEFEGVLIPGLEVKAFELDRSSEAEMWLSR